MKKARKRKRRAAMNTYVSSVGRVCYSWNRLVEALGRIFVEITKMDLQVAQAIWHSVRNDRTQMTMLEAAIKKVPEDRWLPRLPRARKDLRWLMKESISLAEARNKAVHTPCSVEFGKNGAVVVSDPFSGNPPETKLSKTTLQDEFECCIEWATCLETFACEVIVSLRSEHSSAWPDTPALPKRTQVN
jgi:hypothetical protein